MNKTVFWTGLSMQLLQLSAILVYLSLQFDWSWLTLQLVSKALIGVILIVFNLTSLLFMISGAVSRRKFQ